jgi:hypothetical protein
MPFIEFWGVKTLFWDLDVEFERRARMDHSCELMNPIRFADWCKWICERIRWSYTLSSLGPPTRWCETKPLQTPEESRNHPMTKSHMRAYDFESFAKRLGPSSRM